MSLVHFLLTYDRGQGGLVGHEVFERSDEAVSAYEALEREHCGDRLLEVVLADSLETVMLTQGNYFDAVPPASPYPAEI